jgi:hypothetical protein
MMKTQSFFAGGRIVWLAVVALALTALACGASVEPTATPLPRPTQRPAATATTAAANPTATVRPLPTQGGGSGLVVLPDTPYRHPSGGFTIRLPEDWEVDEKDESIFVTSSDGIVAIEISFINAGATLAADELNTFIQAIEDNFFATFPRYRANPFETQPDGSILVHKTLELSSGTPQTVFSYYWQEGTVVFEQDFWVDTNAYEDYVGGLLEIANSMTTNPAAASVADIYGIVYTFTGPNDYFAIQVPYAWTYDRNESSGLIADAFLAPDGGTYIENITFDDGQPRADLSGFARQLLADYYGVNDLEVEEEVPQSDGSVRLDWSSAAQGITGETFYETRGASAILLLTWIVPGDAYALYQPVWTAVIGSYTIPGSE